MLARLLLHRQHAHLAGAGINQQSQSERLIALGGEILDALRLAIFGELEVIALQIRNEGAALVLDVAVDIDHVHVDAQRAHGLVFALTLAAAGSAAGWLLRHERRAKQQSGEENAASI